MHIALTVNYSPWSKYSGGGQRSTHSLACALSRAGHRVDVVYTRPPWEAVHTPPSLPYRVHWASLAAVRSHRSAALRPLSSFSVASQLDKIRPDATVILIVVTDEEDELFEEYFTFLPHDPANGALPAASRSQMEMVAQPFVDYLLKPDVGATMFGLYNAPGDPCMSAAEYGYAIDYMVSASGGSGGSICQANVTTTLQSIADATAGLASALRLLGTPVAPSLEVLRANAATGILDTVARSRADGYDYDGTVNRIAFYGPNPPQTGDRVVIPYLRWENSVSMCMIDSDCPRDAQKLRCVDGTCR